MKNHITQLAYWWDLVRGSYWFVPTLMCFGAILLAIGAIQADQAWDDPSWSTRTYSGGAEGARSVLSTIAGSMITVAGVVFSITIVALTLASSQFGPRLLRNFMRDRANQFVLGTFTATFVYCLIVLRSVRGLEESTFVPDLAVTVGILLALLSLGVLIFYIHHVAVCIRVATLIDEVTHELLYSIDHLYPEQLGEGELDPEDEELPSLCLQESTVVVAERSGYLVTVSSDELMSLAEEKELIVRGLKRPGHFVTKGSELAEVWGEGAVPTDLIEKVNESFVVSAERTALQDIEFSVEQLAEIAVRALSPGINDPFTAVNCIDGLTRGLCSLAERKLPAKFRKDASGKLRVIAEPIPFPKVLATAVRQVRQYGERSVAVLIRLLEMLTTLVPYTRRSSDREALAFEGDLVLQTAQRALPEEEDVKDVRARHEKLIEALRAVKESS